MIGKASIENVLMAFIRSSKSAYLEGCVCAWEMKVIKKRNMA
jgi:hypothetical protein